MTEDFLLIPVFNMPLGFNNIIGNERLKEYFSERIISNNFPHAIILEGAYGSGKRSFATALAQACLCQEMDKPCGVCKNCRQIKDGVAPDVKIISLPEDKATISVDAVRFIKNDVLSVPCEGDYKFYIVSDAEKMTVQAQNALLKILEEPPSFVVFILLCENANLLLSTIRSRAPVFRMQKFTCEELSDILISVSDKAGVMAEKDPQLYEKIVKSADGSIGMAVLSLDKRSADRLSGRRELISRFLTVLTGVDKITFAGMEDELPSKREELNAFVGELRSAFRDMLVYKKGNHSEYMFFDSFDEVDMIASGITMKSVVSLICACDQVLSMNEINGNLNLLKINYISTLWKCVH